jgi:hypothetical protein
MVQTVGSEDMISFNNNNEWLNEHPSKAIIFDDPESTWERIKAPYNETFIGLVMGELPEGSKLIAMLKDIQTRLTKISWEL